MMQSTLPYTIRPMEPGDVPTVVTIDRLSFPLPWSASTYLYELHHNKTSFLRVLLKPSADGGQAVTSAQGGWRQWLRGAIGLSQEESRVIGYVGFRLQVSGVHISTIAVHPDWKNKGLGELLLLTAIEQALELNAEIVTLEVRASNHIAQRLYRKYGFQFTGIHQAYYRDGEDARLMQAVVGHGAYRARLADLRRALEARLHWQSR